MEASAGYKINPKTKDSGILTAIPQTGTCPNECPDCFFQSGRSYLEPLKDNLPNMPDKYNAEGRIVRVNDGNDSNVDKKLVMDSCQFYDMKFYNTAIPTGLDEFDGPVVLTINPGEYTDESVCLLDIIPDNLMFVRIRTNTWNIDLVRTAIAHYSEREVPVILTFMAYYCDDAIPQGDGDDSPSHVENYVFRKRTTNSYWAITTEAWEEVMSEFKYNRWVYSCGKVEGEKGTTACRHCGNCIREYFATMEKLRED